MLLFIAVTCLPAVGLVWLGTTLLVQDQQLAEKQLRDRLERDADTVIAGIANDLRQPALKLAAVATADSDRAPAALWRPAQDAENIGQFNRAIAENRRLSWSSDKTVRAEALIRMARVLRRAGRTDEALAVYDQMTDMDDVRVMGDPASLLAALARVRELKRRNAAAVRDREAASIRSDLARGRWQLDPASLEAAWAEVTTPELLAAEWVDRWRGVGLLVALAETGGQPIVDSGRLRVPVVVRSPPDSGLPWVVRVSSASPETDLAAFGNRRRELILVLSLSSFLVIAGAYFVARGIRRELAAADLQSSFVSAVSHEFRTPLTSIGHLIELLRDRTNLDEARRARYYQALEQETSRLRRFVDQLLDFGRADAGEGAYRLEPHDAKCVIDKVIQQFVTGPAAREHAVTWEPPSRSMPVRIDPEAFGVALNNLLDNAAKYSSERTAIHVSLELDAASQRLLLRVRDQGCGVPRSEQAIIFEKFVRGTHATTSNIRGTGVGLALARQIARAHGGDINVDSQVGHGSTFTISLPLEGSGAGVSGPD